MNGVDVIKLQSQTMADLIEQSFASVTPEQCGWHRDGSKANTIGPTFIHAHLTEDRVVSRQQGHPPLFEANGWSQRLNFDPARPWSEQQVTDVDACRAYAAEVTAQTKTYLENIDPNTLDNVMEMGPLGSQTVAFALSLATVLHKSIHLGEISALLGEQGEKGFPF